MCEVDTVLTMSSVNVPEPLLGEDTVLDNPVWYSLTGAHRELAVIDHAAARYPGEVSPFTAVAPGAGSQDWDRLAALARADPVTVVESGVSGAGGVPATWALLRRFELFQMCRADPGDEKADSSPVAGWPELEFVRLGAAEGAEMVQLAEHTRPGPFGRRTVELGVYFGLRHNGRLIAMAGERLQPPGWSEVSAVCTEADYRGRGIARFLMESVIEAVVARGDRPFLHVVQTNAPAIRLYRAMGFAVRRAQTISSYQPESR